MIAHISLLYARDNISYSVGEDDYRMLTLFDYRNQMHFNECSLFGTQTRFRFITYVSTKSS